MSTRPLSPHYHVGIVVRVPRGGSGAADRPPRRHVGAGHAPRCDRLPRRLGSGPRAADDDLLLGRRAALELIEELPGSVWVCNEHSNLHHIGFWSDDLTGDSAGLTRAGCPLQVCGRAGDLAPVSFAYHRDDLGVRIEVVDTGMRDAMSFLFSPGES